MQELKKLRGTERKTERNPRYARNTSKDLQEIEKRQEQMDKLGHGWTGGPGKDKING